MGNNKRRAIEFLFGFIPALIGMAILIMKARTSGGGMGGLVYLGQYLVFILPTAILAYLTLALLKKFWVGIGVVAAVLSPIMWGLIQG